MGKKNYYQQALDHCKRQCETGGRCQKCIFLVPKHIVCLLKLYKHDKKGYRQELIKLLKEKIKKKGE